MTEPIFQYPECGRPSSTGHWCQACIEREWPNAAWGNGGHWIVWKGVTQARPDRFEGALGCPYRLGQISTPQGVSNWLLSPLGALKEGHGSHLLAATVSVRTCALTKRLVLNGLGPVMPLAAFPRDEAPDGETARAWLSDVNRHLAKIEAFERRMGDAVRRMPDLYRKAATLDRTIQAHSDQLQRSLRRLSPREVRSSPTATACETVRRARSRTWPMR